MGIKNFHKFLRKHYPEIYTDTSLSTFSNKKVAIDINIYLFKYKSIHKERWINVLFSLIILLKKYNIDCVCIYDTKSPVEKDARKQERKQRKKNAEDKIHEIQEDLLKYNQTGIASDLLKQISHKKGALKKVLNIQTDVIDREAIYRELTSLSNQIVNITKYDVAISKQLLQILGIPYYDADGEAESLCSYLCCHGKVDAVLSDDTDVLVYGTPCFLTKLNLKQETCVVLTPEPIFEKLRLTKEQFVDLCIMSGTDYNDNIPNIGNEKAYILLQKHSSLELIEQEKKELDTQILNYKRIREIFTVPAVLREYLLENKQPNLQELEPFAVQHRIQYHPSRMKVFTH